MYRKSKFTQLPRRSITQYVVLTWCLSSDQFPISTPLEYRCSILQPGICHLDPFDAMSFLLQRLRFHGNSRRGQFPWERGGGLVTMVTTRSTNRAASDKYTWRANHRHTRLFGSVIIHCCRLCHTTIPTGRVRFYATKADDSGENQQ